MFWPVPVEEILPVYYTRQQVEQTFDVCKNYTDLLPLRIESEDKLRGHLLLTFIASCIVRRIQNKLLATEKKRSGRLNPISLFQNLGCQHCSVYKDKIIVHEADSKANKGYNLFEIEAPKELKV
ncbi:transposase [Erysipelotrichaceae bacterium RD49]|nr:transposase [Erysipelotrichaceae bacterium RD49]